VVEQGSMVRPVDLIEDTAVMVVVPPAANGLGPVKSVDCSGGVRGYSCTKGAGGLSGEDPLFK